MKHAVTLTVAFITALTGAQGLNCYVCEDCVHVDGNTLTQPCSDTDGLNFLTTTTPTPPTFAPIPPLTPPYPQSVAMKLGRIALPSFERELPNAVYECYITTAKNSSGSLVTRRGCVITATTDNACEELKKHDNDATEICSVCSVDKCNSGTTLSFVLSLNLYVIVAMIISKLVS